MILEFLNEHNWTKTASARDRYENEVEWHSVDAESWDLTTAIKISHSDYESFWKALTKVKTFLRLEYQTKLPVWKWQDLPETSWHDIKRVLTFTGV